MGRNKIKVYHYHFPISLLQGFRAHPEECLDNIFDFMYVCYKEANKNKDDKILDMELGIICGDKPYNQRKKEVDKINKKQPYSRIGRDTYWKVTTKYRNENNCGLPTDSETASLLCYLGLLSISGKVMDREVKTTKDLLFSRMSGNASFCADSIEDWLQRFMTRKRFDNLKKSVEEAFNIEFSKGHQRGVKFKVRSGL